jgi:hypothetical protein
MSRFGRPLLSPSSPLPRFQLKTQKEMLFGTKPTQVFEMSGLISCDKLQV